VARVLPYHKSVLDWLGSESDAGAELWVDVVRGHALAGAACHGTIMALPTHDDGEEEQAGANAPAANSDTGSTAAATTPQVAYAVRHVVRHLAVAAASAEPQTGSSSGGALAEVLMHFGFWQAAYAAGACGWVCVPACSLFN
jgi:hypothetical protein